MELDVTNFGKLTPLQRELASRIYTFVKLLKYMKKKNQGNMEICLLKNTEILRSLNKD